MVKLGKFFEFFWSRPRVEQYCRLTLLARIQSGQATPTLYGLSTTKRHRYYGLSTAITSALDLVWDNNGGRKSWVTAPLWGMDGFGGAGWS